MDMKLSYCCSAGLQLLGCACPAVAVKVVAAAFPTLLCRGDMLLCRCDMRAGTERLLLFNCATNNARSRACWRYYGE